MRISSNYQYQVYTNEIDNASSAMNTAQEVLSTGKQINQLSDNPYGAMDALNMTSLQSQINQYSSNLGTAKDALSDNENALTQVTSLLNQAYQIAESGANSTLTPSALGAMASQISDIQSSLVTIGNTQNSSGQYIFAGQKTQSAPFSVDSNGNLTYSGDSGNISIEVAPGQNMTVNAPGSPLFTGIYQALSALKSDLTSGNVSAISNTDIASLKSQMDTVSNMNGQFGAQIDTVNGMLSDNTQRTTDLTTSISNVVDANMAQAAVTLSQAQTAYQAALEATAKVSQVSLLDFITS